MPQTVLFIYFWDIFILFRYICERLDCTNIIEILILMKIFVKVLRKSTILYFSCTRDREQPKLSLSTNTIIYYGIRKINKKKTNRSMVELFYYSI